MAQHATTQQQHHSNTAGQTDATKDQRQKARNQLSETKGEREAETRGSVRRHQRQAQAVKTTHLRV